MTAEPESFAELTDEDRAALRAISDDADNPRALLERVFAYYHDDARARRTPREMMYLHMGMLTGALARALKPEA